MIKIEFTEEERLQLNHLRFHHPHPRVRQKMEVLWLKSQGLPHYKIAKLSGVNDNTMRSYFYEYLQGGLKELAEFNIYKPQSELMKFEKMLKEHFDKNPPATVKEAASEIEKLTGIKRCETQIRNFLKKMGMRLLKVGQIPAKADPKEQKKFKKKELEPRLKEAKEGTRIVFFVDAAHFVMGGFLGFVWCRSRKFIQTPSGRKRYNVLGALNALTKEVIAVTNDTYINSESVCELLEKLKKQHPDKPITLFLDNAKYQHCLMVKERAEELGIELLFLPPYSPNLNLIERFWKWLKKKCLYSKYYERFEDFKTAIFTTLQRSRTDYKKELSSLLTFKFQIIKKTQILNL